MARKYLILLLVLLNIILLVGMSNAQTDDAPPPLRVLVSGVDINGQGFPLVLIHLDEQRPETLATFANRPICSIEVFPEGASVYYELWDASGVPYIYQLGLPSGERVLVEQPNELPLTCPQVTPDGTTIAWYQNNADGTVSVILTDINLEEQREFLTVNELSGLQWSPAGGALIYESRDMTGGFPTLYSLPRQGGANPRLVFGAQNGLLQDYVWTSDSTGLLIAYTTEAELAIALLPTGCVIGPGELCDIEPIATFPFEYSITLLESYSPLRREAVVSVEFLTDAGVLNSDLWLLDLEGNRPPRQLTFTPDVLETDATFIQEQNRIYFIGTRFDSELQRLRGAIYRINLESGGLPEMVFESNVFSPSRFLWWYE